jgi:hypothetical protein
MAIAQEYLVEPRRRRRRNPMGRETDVFSPINLFCIPDCGNGLTILFTSKPWIWVGLCNGNITAAL